MSFTLNPKAVLRMSAKVHRCDYFPVVRDDYESFLGAGITLKASPKLSVTADLVKHRAWNNLDSVPEREFSRNLVMLAMAIQL